MPSAAAATARCSCCRTGRFEGNWSAGLRPARGRDARAPKELRFIAYGTCMTTESIAAPIRPRGLLATPSYARLWFAGGVGNAMRWLELLVAGIFTYDATHSALLVAVVTMARSLPMLFLGPLAGVVGEAFNRKRLLQAQVLLMMAASAVL